MSGTGGQRAGWRAAGQLDAIHQVLYNRELAYFDADHDLKLDTALELVRRELTVRQDIYAYDLLGWTLSKNGRHAVAQAAMARALGLGTRTRGSSTTRG
jgi:hypothetical protein